MGRNSNISSFLKMTKELSHKQDLAKGEWDAGSTGSSLVLHPTPVRRVLMQLNRTYVSNGSEKTKWAGQWGHTPLIPALRKQRQADLCEFRACLVYRVSSRTASATQRNPVLEN